MNDNDQYFQAIQGVEERRAAIVELLEELNCFHASLLIRLTNPTGLGQASKTVIIAIMACVLDILLIATKLFSRSAWRTRLGVYSNIVPLCIMRSRILQPFSGTRSLKNRTCRMP